MKTKRTPEPRIIDAEIVDSKPLEVRRTRTLRPTKVRRGMLTPASLDKPQIPASVPESGFRRGLREVGHVVGVLTWPVWRPCLEIARDTKKLFHVHQAFLGPIRSWWLKSKADRALWESWTQEERGVVLIQASVWGGIGLGCMGLAFMLPGIWKLVPMVAGAVLWHLRYVGERFDLVAKWMKR